VSFDAAYGGERVTAYLYLPKKVRPPYQTILFFPSARVLEIANSDTLGDLKFFDYIVQSGRAVMYPVYQSTYERNKIPPWPLTTELVTERFKDLSRSIDYLKTRPDVDANKLAYVGVSMGSAEGVIYAALLQDKFRTAVFLDGGFFLYKLPPGIDQVDFAPRLKLPVLMVNGRYDFSFSLERAQNPLFVMLGTAEADKRHVVMESPHDVTVRRGQLLQEVLSWLDKYLGPVE
jgi:eukaryotic-like serine/threonine-protein kinase